MEQKTEASQAVDEPVLPHLPRAVGYRHTMDNTEGLKGNKPVAVFCVTKPNPFGIPGLDYSASFPVTTETLFTADQMKAYARAALKAQPAPTEAAEQVHAPAERMAECKAFLATLPAQGEDSARLDWIERVIQQKSSFVALPCGDELRFVQVRSFGDCENYPTVKGLRAAIDAARARASAETGGVKS